MNACEVCGQTEFTVEEGFHYCVECGTKSQQHGTELVAEFDENLPVGVNAVSGGAIRLKQVKKKGKMLTSFEVVNYILVGYADRLVAMGAGEEFKLTVLQLWAAYLRRMEVAFFDKQKPERPRLEVFHKAMDATILYNRKIKKKRERRKSADSGSRTSSVPSSGVALTKKVRSEQRSLLNAEYDSFRASQQSDVNRSLHELSVRSLNASLSGTESDNSSKSGGQRIKYSRLARIKMKRKLKMSTSHIEKHESDVEDVLQCHGKGVKSKLFKAKKMEPEKLTRTVISSLLALGLNASRSRVQLADLLRFYREEHISATSLMQYIPEEVDITSLTETLGQLQKGLSLSHNELQMGVSKLMKFLNVKAVTPDWSQLCKRYLEELCLPADLMVFLDRLLAVFPPKMPFTMGSFLPNYECRAMALILFMLKLLFGCNDSTEVKLSKSAAKFNAMLKNLGPSYRPLFVFREWIQFLEMRKVILAQAHHATNRSVAKEEGVEPDPELFIDHNLRRKQSGDSFRVCSKHQLNRNWMSKLKDFATNAINTQHRRQPNQRSARSIEFEPSLTPFRSYLETFLLAYNQDGRIHIPDFMHENHADRTVVPLVSPSDLKQLLRSHHQITLKTKKVPSAISDLEFIDPAIANNMLHTLLESEAPYLYIDECDKSDWSAPPKRTYHAKSHERILTRVLIRNEEEHEVTLNGTRSNITSFDEADQTATNSTMTNLLSDFSDAREPGSSQDDFIPLYQNTTHSLLTTNCDYWVRFYPTKIVTTREKFNEKIATNLPESFRQVLEECARIVEDHPMAVYRELLTVEAYLFYAVQPVERFFDGTADCEVLFGSSFESRLIGTVREAKERY